MSGAGASGVFRWFLLNGLILPKEKSETKKLTKDEKRLRFFTEVLLKDTCFRNVIPGRIALTNLVTGITFEELELSIKHKYFNSLTDAEKEIIKLEASRRSIPYSRLQLKQVK